MTEVTIYLPNKLGHKAYIGILSEDGGPGLVWADMWLGGLYEYAFLYPDPEHLRLYEVGMKAVMDNSDRYYVIEVLHVNSFRVDIRSKLVDKELNRLSEKRR